MTVVVSEGPGPGRARGMVLVVAVVVGSTLSACGSSCSPAQNPVTAAAKPAVPRASTAGPSSWHPPAGVPPPPFGILEEAPPPPEPWNESKPGFYYVDATSRSARDLLNPYGTPATPRETVPKLLPAGAVVEIHGSYPINHEGRNGLRAEGTKERPIFIRGRDAKNRPRLVRPFEIRGSYFVLENLEFGPRNAEETGFVSILAPADHGVVRHNDFHGLPSGGGVSVGGQDGALVEDAVVFDNDVHDTGDARAATDLDRGGIAVGGGSRRIWILDNRCSNNGRDGITLVQGSGNKHPLDGIRFVYVGRNRIWGNRQGGFWTKEASDVVVSENTCFGHRPNSGGVGHGLGGQYGGERIWFLFNHVYDNERGIQFPDIGSAYLVGNVIHAIHHSITGYDPANLYDSQTGQAIYFRNSGSVVAVNNTIYDVDAGIVGVATARVQLVNNLIASPTADGARHIHCEGAKAEGSEVRSNLLAGKVRVSWGDATWLDLRGLSSRVPGGDNISAEASFQAASEGDFRLTASSRAIDRGVVSAVYARFFELYGIDIARDAAGRPRPQGSAWDIGAYEWEPPR
jgi:hypothetical protein